jgi:serralysin
VTYYHIELERHDVVLSEGLATESYLDTGDRAKFGHPGRSILLHPDFSAPRYPHLSSLIWEAKGCAPLAVTGPAVTAAHSLLRANLPTHKPRSEKAITA